MPVKRQRLPQWLRVPFRGARARQEVRRILKELNLHTVCESANCPNLCECWSKKTATFMLLGERCTRNCRFCAVEHGLPDPLDPNEPENVAMATEKLNLHYVVLTCVTRDDLPDGGAAHFAATIATIRKRLPNAGIEVLPSDMGGQDRNIATIMAAHPTVFNHNIETCERLTPLVRSNADYRRSLRVLATAAHLASNENTHIKSGFRLGLGEQASEIHDTLKDLRQSNVEILTMGQYLPPSSTHWPLERYVRPEEFEKWADVARNDYGFSYVVSNPPVRSSYMAEEAVAELKRTCQCSQA